MNEIWDNVKRKQWLELKEKEALYQYYMRRGIRNT